MIKILIVAAIMVVINLFMIYAVTKAVGSLEATVRRYYIARLGKEDFVKDARQKNSDVLIISGGKEAEHPAAAENEQIRIVEVEKESVPQAAAAQAGVVAESTRYKNSDFREDFLTVRRMDILDGEAALRNVMEIQNREHASVGAVVRSIREILDYDTAFRLSSRDAGEQEQILRSVLNGEQQKVLDAYLAVSRGRFNAIDFYGYLEEQAGVYDENFYIHRPGGVRETVPDRENVKNVRDDSVTAGMKIVYQNKLYDYSI